MQRYIALGMFGGFMLASTAASAAAKLDPVFDQLPVNEKIAYMQKFGPVTSKLGSGYNAFTKKMLGVGGCVNGTFIPPESKSSSPSYRLDIVTSYEQFNEDTSVEAEVSGSLGGFSASAKSEFSSSESSKSTKTHLLVREFVKTMEVNLDHRSMTLAAAFRIKGSDKTPASLGPFLQACGDQFVARFDMGGEFMALLTSDLSEDDLKSTLKVQASASYAGESASGEFNRSMDRLRTASSLSVTMTRVGGSGDLPEISTAAGSGTIDAILTYASKFPTNVEKAPVIYSLEAIPYREGINFDTADYTASKTAYDKLLNNRNRLEAAVTGLTHDLNAYVDWSLPAESVRPKVQDRLTAARAELSLINPILETCGNTYWLEHSCDAPARFLDDNYAAPVAPRLIVQNLNTQSGDLVAMNLPGVMYVALRGNFCYDGSNTWACLVNGVWDWSKSGDVYISVKGNGTSTDRYFGGILKFQPGQLFIQLHDTNFTDDSGDLSVIAFEEP